MNKELLTKFKVRECKAKDIFEIREINKSIAYEFVRRYHYLKDAKFFAMYSYGLYFKENDELCGCATYSLPQGRNTSFGWFGLSPGSKEVVELSRLCVLPELNNTNATSFLLGNSMKMLRPKSVRAIITLADATRHVGSIYQVCNFKYYGLCADKDYFYALDGRIMPRGKLHDVAGVWLDKPPKHRYAFILDNTLTCKYAEKEYPKSGELEKIACCDNKFVVEDRRYHKYYTCPKCTKKMLEIDRTLYDKMFKLSETMTTEELKTYIDNYISNNYHDDSLFDIEE